MGTTFLSCARCSLVEREGTRDTEFPVLMFEHEHETMTLCRCHGCCLPPSFSHLLTHALRVMTAPSTHSTIRTTGMMDKGHFPVNARRGRMTKLDSNDDGGILF